MMPKCGRCDALKDLWAVNHEGGYGEPRLDACTACLRGAWCDMVPRLLETYPSEDAAELRAALEQVSKTPRRIRE